MNTSENTSDTLLDTLSIAGALVRIEQRQILRAEGFGRGTLAALRAIDAGHPADVVRIERLRAREWVQAGETGVVLTALGAETLDRVNTAIAALAARVAAAVESPDALRALVAELGGPERLAAARAAHAGRHGHGGGRRGFGPFAGRGHGRHGHGRPDFGRDEFGRGHGGHGHGRPSHGHGRPDFDRGAFEHGRPGFGPRREHGFRDEFRHESRGADMAFAGHGCGCDRRHHG